MIEGPESLERGFGVSYTIFTSETLRSNSGTYPGFEFILVAEWIHFTLWGKILPIVKLKVYTVWGL